MTKFTAKEILDVIKFPFQLILYPFIVIKELWIGLEKLPPEQTTFGSKLFVFLGYILQTLFWIILLVTLLWLFIFMLRMGWNSYFPHSTAFR